MRPGTGRAASSAQHTSAASCPYTNPRPQVPATPVHASAPHPFVPPTSQIAPDTARTAVDMTLAATCWAPHAAPTALLAVCRFACRIRGGGHMQSRMQVVLLGPQGHSYGRFCGTHGVVGGGGRAHGNTHTVLLGRAHRSTHSVIGGGGGLTEAHTARLHM